MWDEYLVAVMSYGFSDVASLLEITHKLNERIHAFDGKSIVNRSANAADRAMTF
jgi:hypothetical protein